MTEEITPMQEAFLVSQQLRQAVEDLTAADINRMSVADYGKVRERAGLPAVDPYSDAYAAYEPPQAQATVSAPEAVHSNADGAGGLDIGSIDMNTYAQLRGRLGVTGREYGKGALDQAGGSAEWIEAARAKTGRTAYGQQNTQDAPRIGRAFVHKAQPVQGRASWYHGA